ncbi:hypothetical protein LQR31_03565 [Chromobacterium vaccinii]|uniref:Uncharacterized protein n=2 Tax=Chromobacteriaceae TaxID=1499392 RepID=A0ABV0FB10_9NEIS|nr:MULTISPECIES: hypothetical protein [Chromobacteriaceae]AVG15208.1 hypothetical protein CFN79_04670 [Chromobacterium vaccinii]ERE14896.1 hypothetical protein O166_23275 [Pseudogulbenkiania ferrooxidans EGD-HP2]MCD4483551.1 hypothetical protein [Chromobacterium vaccinii]MCD4498490.1 hypothetical protein [Chromobacterium vaccinii]SUX29686.1 Uncharacterised protein [Chromobacterium vaccinii]
MLRLLMTSLALLLASAFASAQDANVRPFDNPAVPPSVPLSLQDMNPAPPAPVQAPAPQAPSTQQ